MTDEFSDAAVRFVSDNKDKPFFLFLSYNAPHAPLQATQEYLDRFPKITDQKRKTYAAMVSAVDDGVGRVLTRLRELDLENDTMIFFLSDNGGPTTKNASQNTPLRGDKGDAWEGGFRVPFAAKWPNGLPRGKVYDQPISSLDIFATIAALTDAGIDPDRPLDGVNLVPYITGTKDGPPHKSIYLRMFDLQKYAIRSGDYKLVIPAHNENPQLFNLATDVSESNNLALGHSGKRAELQQELEDWANTLVEPRFMGLIHTEAWKKRLQNKEKKNRQTKDQ